MTTFVGRGGHKSVFDQVSVYRYRHNIYSMGVARGTSHNNIKSVTDIKV